MTILDADQYYIPKGKLKQNKRILPDNIRTLIENRDKSDNKTQTTIDYRNLIKISPKTYRNTR